MPVEVDENGSSLRLGLHQYTHFLTRNYHPQDLPRRYEEGLAGYLSALNITDTGVEMPQYTAAAFESSLQISRYMPLEKLIFDASALSSPALIQVANRKSTDFLHYLLHAWEDQGFKDRRVHLTNYLDLINEGREHRYAFRRAFAMSSPRMDRNLSRY